MSRPEKKQRDPDAKPRSLKVIFKILEGTNHLYLQTGGNDIDEALRGLRHTMSAYDSQMAAIEAQAEVGVEYSEQRQMGWGPNVSAHEARLTASRISILVKQREEKMAECQALIEEGFAAKEAEEAAKAAEATAPEQAAPEGNAPEGTVPEVRDCPRSSSEDNQPATEGAASQPAPASAFPQDSATQAPDTGTHSAGSGQAVPNFGDSPLSHSQAPRVSMNRKERRAAERAARHAR